MRKQLKIPKTRLKKYDIKKALNPNWLANRKTIIPNLLNAAMAFKILKNKMILDKKAAM